MQANQTPNSGRTGFGLVLSCSGGGLIDQQVDRLGWIPASSFVWSSLTRWFVFPGVERLSLLEGVDTSCTRAGWLVSANNLSHTHIYTHKLFKG